ncbi:MAG: sugar ABC transporter permease [Chloroflexi bacterium]|nr:sugar ABC transporter permease [Chloroflexota bacterium]
MTVRSSIEAGSVRLLAEQHKSLWRRIVDHKWCYIFITPAAIFYLAFTVWPILASWYYSFFDWRGIGRPEEYVGLANFIEVASDKYFWSAMLHTFEYMFGVVILNLPTTLIMAIILNNPRLKGAAVYRVIYFLPVVTTTAIVGIVMTYIFGPFNGAFNTILIRLGLISKPIHWLGLASTAMPTIIVVAVWKGFGTNMLYWLAGLQAIPQELYEAAKVDGANAIQAFWHITLPLLKPVGLVILLFTVVGSLHVFDLIKVMTDGGPYFRTETVSIFIYRYAFGQVSRIGFASAAGIFFGLVAMIFSILQGLLIRRGGSIRIGGGAL